MREKRINVYFPDGMVTSRGGSESEVHTDSTRDGERYSLTHRTFVYPTIPPYRVIAIALPWMTYLCLFMDLLDVGSWLNLLDVLQVAGSDYCAQTLAITR